MADSKITALANLTAADPVNDMFPIVDVSDTTMAASGTTKRISANNILSSSPTASGALTVTGLVTAGSATITGAATVGTTLGVTGASNLSGALTVSTGSNATPLTLTCSNAAGTTFNLANTGGAGTHAFGGYNAMIGNGNVTDLLISSAGQTIIRAGGINVATFATAGNLTVGTGNVVMATSGKGIDFSATAGTGTSELLNDYEEGTWTPAINALVGTFTTTTLNSATYTKIGRMVAIQAKFAVTTIGTGSAGFQLANLPFTSSPTNAFVIAGKNLSSDADFGGFIESTGTTMRFVVVMVNSHTYLVNGTYTV